MSDPSAGPASEQDLSTLHALYAAHRADGSAIYAVSIQLVGIMVAYAAVSFAVLGSDLLARQEWVRGFIAVPLWGLAAYVVANGRLHAERDRVIKQLEAMLVLQLATPWRPALLDPACRKPPGLRQRPLLAGITALSYSAAFSGVLGLSVYSVWSIFRDAPALAVVSGAVYVLAAALIVIGASSRDGG